MANITSKETIPEFYGMYNVTMETHDDGEIEYRTQCQSFVSEANYTKACKLNTAKDAWGDWLYLFNSEDIMVGKYLMTKRLSGFTPKQLVDQKSKLFFFKIFNQTKKVWESIVDGTPAKNESYKEGCGLMTVLTEGKWFVINKEKKYIVEPGKYDYIDGFDTCGLARVKKNGKTSIHNPKESTPNRWGIIDTKGNEVLPLIYTEIWPFYGKNRRWTKVFKGGEDDCGNYYDKAIEYRFELYSHKLIDVEEEQEERNRMANIEYNYSMWDAFEGSEEAAAAYGWEF